MPWPPVDSHDLACTVWLASTPCITHFAARRTPLQSRVGQCFAVCPIFFHTCASPTSSSVYPLLTPVARCLNHTWTRHSLHSSMHMRYPIQAGHATNRVGSCPQAQHGWYRLHLAARGWPIPLAVAGGSPELDPARLTRHRGMGAAQSLATSRTCPAAHRRFPGTREFGAPAGARMCECRQREEV